MKNELQPGRYYLRTARGLEPIGDFDQRPDNVICRRVTDYAPAPVPAGAAVACCTRCGADVVYNPAGPHQNIPKICMQCAEIQPLPIP